METFVQRYFLSGDTTHVLCSHVAKQVELNCALELVALINSVTIYMQTAECFFCCG